MFRSGAPRWFRTWESGHYIYELVSVGAATLRGTAGSEAVWRRGGGDAAMTRGTADGILSLFRHCHLEGFLDKKNSL